MVTVRCAWEHNKSDSLLYAVDFVGAYTRGENLKAATEKMPSEIRSYLKWTGGPIPNAFSVVLTEEKNSDLAIRDADSDFLLESERAPLTKAEYDTLKALALKSAADFLVLYQSVPDKHATSKPERTTFYGKVPRSAQEMYEHTKSVNAYYFAEIGVNADNSGSIYECRLHGFKVLESQPDYLKSAVVEGSYGEEWSLRKVLRRFIWHDRIHARAMYRMAVSLFDAKDITNPFCFERN